MSTSTASNLSFSDMNIMNRKHRNKCAQILPDMLSAIAQGTEPRLYIDVHEQTKGSLLKYSVTRDVLDTLLWDMDIT